MILNCCSFNLYYNIIYIDPDWCMITFLLGTSPVYWTSFWICLWSILVRNSLTAALKTADAVIGLKGPHLFSDLMTVDRYISRRMLFLPSCFNLFLSALITAREKTPSLTTPVLCHYVGVLVLSQGAKVDVIVINLKGDFNLCQDRSCTVESNRLAITRLSSSTVWRKIQHVGFDSFEGVCYAISLRLL